MSSLVQILEKCPEATLQPMNKYIMEVSCKTKKRPAFLKIAVDDETAQAYLSSDDPIGIIVYFKRSDYDKAIEELKET
jgi:hypothetical protein